MLGKMLEEDKPLHDLERDLTEKLARKEATATCDKVKQQIAKLLQEAGLEVREEGPSAEPGGEEPRQVPNRGEGRPRKQQPLPTRPYPQVTRFEIVSPKPKMEVRQGDTEVVLVETDADAEFHRKGDVRIRIDPPDLEVALAIPLRGGRVRWRLRPTAAAKAGATGKIIVTLTKPDGSQLSDAIEYEVFAAIEQKTKPSKGNIPPFNVIPIHPEDNAEQWHSTWPEMGETPSSEEVNAVAYRAVRGGGGINVFYSSVFPPFAEVVDRLKTSNQPLLELFTTQYEIWIGYHAILQESRKHSTPDGVEPEAMERLLDLDRAVVARMQVKQALQVGELMRKLSVDQPSE